MGCISSINKQSISEQTQQPASALPTKPGVPGTPQRPSELQSSNEKAPLQPSDPNKNGLLSEKKAARSSKISFDPDSTINDKENVRNDPDLDLGKNLPLEISDSKRASSRRKSRFYVEDPVDLSQLAQESKREEPYLDSHGSLDPEQSSKPITDPRKYDSVTNFAGAESQAPREINMKSLYGKIDLSERKNPAAI